MIAGEVSVADKVGDEVVCVDQVGWSVPAGGHRWGRSCSLFPPDAMGWHSGALVR